MEISEIRSNLRKLEDKIEALISEFEKTTEYGVKTIEIKSLTQCKGAKTITEILSVNINLHQHHN